MTNTISKDSMRSILSRLSADRVLIAPASNGKVIEFRETTPESVLFDDSLSYKSIKEYFFPQTEHMFTFKDGGIEEAKDIQSFLIFGARPCDLEALRVMKSVYTTGKYADPFFKKRFDVNFIIGISCHEKKSGCFCDMAGVNKEFSDFCDIMLKDENSSYVIEFMSEKAKAELPELMASAGCDIAAEKTSTAADGLALNLNINDVDYFDIIDWEAISQTCLGCGMCCYICPTCHCFDFKDVFEQGETKRYKCWDSCIYSKFTVHASGHNPRERLHERYRQRVLHKFKYIPTNFDLLACTGCGRCLRSCPVGINIKDVVTQIMEVQP